MSLTRLSRIWQAWEAGDDDGLDAPKKECRFCYRKLARLRWVIAQAHFEYVQKQR
jgi:hypothetical protein